MLIKLKFQNYSESHEYFGTPTKQMEFHQKAFKTLSWRINHEHKVPFEIKLEEGELQLQSVEPPNEEGIRVLTYKFRGV